MKKDIHPKYNPEAKITCACGNVISTGSVKPEMKIEVCSACHPFYTGKKRLVDSTGRVDRFKKRMEKSEKMAADKLEKAKKKAEPAEKSAKLATVKTVKPVAKKKVVKKKTVKK